MKVQAQPDLFNDRPPPEPPHGYPHEPGHRGVFTQVAAAKKIKRCDGRLHRMIVQHLLRLGEGGATRQEIADSLNLKLQTVCGRVRELVLAGEIRDTDATRGGGRVVVVA
jgi:hypothetical protein